jgi:pyruvate/2-oxoglutarate dehydrogenase complex dihydrolipoamide dehydrogenase (E3) component
LWTGSGSLASAPERSKESHRTAIVERRLVGGSCPNVACLPGKNLISDTKRVVSSSMTFGWCATR